MRSRVIIELIKPRETSDGAGVKLMRVFGGKGPERFDPFLLLDEFGSEMPEDYIGGFPPHPHRGFETVTYMLHGKMEHRDHLGNVGLLSDGGVQWMTAGRGVIHSEMPQQTEGLIHGFQLWVNLPKSRKMMSANYKDIPAGEIPVFTSPGAKVKAIAGKSIVNGQEICGYFRVEDTHVVYQHISVEPSAALEITIDDSLNCLLYLTEGELDVSGTRVSSKSLMRLGDGAGIKLQNTAEDVASVLLIAGTPLKEPIAQYGPFVMNTREEIEQAMQDYQSGNLTG